MNNILLLTDSYKCTHWKQYPKGTQIVYSYLESRGGVYDKTVFFGLQALIKLYLEGKVVTQEKIEEASRFFDKHLGPNRFNRAGWQYILDTYDGHLPVRIKAVPEGRVVSVKNALMTIENTDPNCFWLTNYLETILLHVWYPTTVATLSYHMKETINEYLAKTGTPELIAFKLHDFGFRGVSSCESAGSGGAAHLLNFCGTDTLAGISYAQEHYGADMPGFSIPASEHSTITSWGPECEAAAMENMLDNYPEGLVACVSDSFDIINACKNIWGRQLKEKVLARNGTLVVRPDSGDPVEVVVQVLEALGEAFGTKVNDKGYKVLPDQVRVIQGDGINHESLRLILENMEKHKWSADNVAFGCGGALLQQMNRDTQKFAFKCSSVTVDGEERDVFKDPVTDQGKRSKRGRLKLAYLGAKGLYATVNLATKGADELKDELKTVFENGKLIKEYSFEECRVKAAQER